MNENINNMNMVITVDDGARRVPIQNTLGEPVGEFTFHPTDIGIIERYNRLAEGFGGITEPLEQLEGEADIDDPANAEALREATARLYTAVDELLGSEDAARAFFGKMNPFSPVEGQFYAAHVLGALGAFIGEAFETETAKFSEKAEGYANRAQRRAKK